MAGRNRGSCPCGCAAATTPRPSPTAKMPSKRTGVHMINPPGRATNSLSGDATCPRYITGERYTAVTRVQHEPLLSGPASVWYHHSNARVRGCYDSHLPPMCEEAYGARANDGEVGALSRLQDLGMRAAPRARD